MKVKTLLLSEDVFQVHGFTHIFRQHISEQLMSNNGTARSMRLHSDENFAVSGMLIPTEMEAVGPSELSIVFCHTIRHYTPQEQE